MDKKFKYDPEEENNGNGKYRLPFALCKARGIKIEDWWTPRHAWEALKRGGLDADEAYKDFYRNKKKASSKASRKANKDREKNKNAQLSDPMHNPDPSYIHQDGKIAGVVKGNPMTFEEADSGHVNPHYGKGLIGYRHNCQTCVATYVARRQGYDVRALPNLDNENIYKLSYNTSLAYLTADGQHPSYIYRGFNEKMDSFLDKNVKEGGIFSLQFGWKGRSSAHIVIAEKVNGEVMLYDPQTNNRYNKGDVKNFLSKTERHKLMDLSDVRMDENFCDKIMLKG